MSYNTSALLQHLAKGLFAMHNGGGDFYSASNFAFMYLVYDPAYLRRVSRGRPTFRVSADPDMMIPTAYKVDS